MNWDLIDFIVFGAMMGGVIGAMAVQPRAMMNLMRRI